MKLDLLAVGAHPDDVEISCGGLLLLLQRRGLRVGIVDVTRGELGTRGSREERDSEARAASELMQLSVRHNLEAPDGRVVPTVELRERLAGILREHAPSVVVAHLDDDLHPDHVATGRLAREAWYLSGLKRLAELAGGGPAQRPRTLYHFCGHVPCDPTFVVDVGEVWEQKREVVRCYATQLAPGDTDDDGSHLLFGSDILERMETRGRYWGERIGARYGEPLLHRGPLPFQDPLLSLG